MSDIKKDPFEVNDEQNGVHVGRNTTGVTKDNRKRKFQNRATASMKLSAKSAWINGMSNSEVQKIGGCTSLTLEKWITEWKNDRTQLMQKLRLSELRLSVSEQDIIDHKDYIENLKLLRKQHEIELTELSSVASCLQSILEQLEQHEDFDGKDFRQISALLKGFANAKTARTKIQNDYIKVCDTLNHETGITAYHKAGASRLNEHQRAKGRLDAEMERRELGMSTQSDQQKQGFFDVSPS